MIIYFLIGVFFTSILGFFYPKILLFSSIFSLFTILYFYLQNRKNKQKEKIFKPKSQSYKELEKIKIERNKKDEERHIYITDQISYIENKWGYTKEQKRVISIFMEKRAYSKLYNKLSASLFPQMILLIDDCNAIEKKGCKREVSSRLRELTNLMKAELKKKKEESIESFEVNTEVYDYLLKEV